MAEQNTSTDFIAIFLKLEYNDNIIQNVREEDMD